ncbi:MAG: peptide chain release factor N(5)-glutamine methyltransferase [Candidatus Scalindua sp.]|nr:peptide chain release factor N(5)-glutamine methyltransferase [Candidatus Scalindua sp.]
MTKTQETRTIRHLLGWAIITLKNSNIEFPNSNAETLLSHTLSCDRIELYRDPEKILGTVDIRKYNRLIAQRVKHVPLQYILGHTEFMSLDFVVDERVLIPRHETELLVETALEKIKNEAFSKKNFTLVDIGTGSGAIAISLARNLQDIQVYASDISRDALDVAEMNAGNLMVEQKVNLLLGDLFDAFDGKLEKGSIDCIVSNPPYVKEAELFCLQPEIRDHEPRTALVAGEEGLFYLNRLVDGAPEWLRPDGFLLLEIGETQAESVTKRMEKGGHYINIQIVQDMQKKDRIVSAKRR